MKKHLLVIGIVVVMFAAFPAVSFGEVGAAGSWEIWNLLAGFEKASPQAAKGAAPMLSTEREAALREMMSPDGTFSLKVLDIERGYGVAHLVCELKNVSKSQVDNLNLMITAYQQGGYAPTVAREIGDVAPGQIRIFEAFVPGYAPLITDIECEFSHVGEAAF